MACGACGTRGSAIAQRTGGKFAVNGVRALLVVGGNTPPFTAGADAPPTLATAVTGGGGAVVGTSGTAPGPAGGGPLERTMAGGGAP